MKATFSRHLLNTWTNCVRACFISALLSFCFLAPCSARAEDETVPSPITLDDLDPESRSAVFGLATSMAGASATSATIDDNVSAILTLLNRINPYRGGMYKTVTLPTWESGGVSGTIGGLIGYLMYEGAVLPQFPDISKSYLYEIQRALYGQSGVPTSDSAVVPLLLSLYGSTTNISLTVDTILTMADDIDYHAGSIDNMFNLLSTEYYIGAHPYMWDVHIDDTQLGAISDGFDWLGGYLSNVVEHVGADMGGYLSNIDPYVSDIASAVDAEYESGNMADEFEVSDEYIQDDLSASTNDLGQLEIEPGELPNVYHILDGVDAREFNMLPSLTGADPVIEVFRADRASNLPAFSIDFSVPSGIYNLISLFCTWLWRVLFFVAMWRLVEGEYNYWTTLGGGA